MNPLGKVLVINDAPKISNRLARWLAKKYQYVFVKSAEDADTLMQRERFDVIIYSHEFLFSSTSLPSARHR